MGLNIFKKNNIFGKRRNVSEEIIKKRKDKSIFGVPSATTANIMKSVDSTVSISNSIFFFPDVGTMNLKYSIDWNINGEVGEWLDGDGILANLSFDILLRGDGGDWPDMFIILEQQNTAFGIDVLSHAGGDNTALTNNASQEIPSFDLEAPLTDDENFLTDLGSIQTFNVVWIKARAEIIAGAGNTTFKVQTSENGSSWTTHDTTTSNVDFNIEKKITDLSMRYARVLVTSATNDQHAYFNMACWRD